MTRPLQNVTTGSAPCPLCGHAGDGPFHSHTDFAASAIYQCAACRHVYCWPEPGFAELNAHYEKAYGAKRSMYFGSQYRLLMTRRAEAQAALISRFAKPPGVCIDVGCGIGALVAQMAKVGWTSRGFDGDPDIVKYGTGVLGADITLGTLSDFFASDVTADVLTLSHVLEHLGDLRGSVRKIMEHLRPGGYLFIEVPNELSIPKGDMESHLHFFSRQSLTSLLSSSGLEVKVCSGCGPLAASAPAPASGGVAARVVRGVGSRIDQALRRTPWDGWYDRYHEGDAGLWLRCVARRPN
jgi:SAM-dependent methyltransferase